MQALIVALQNKHAALERQLTEQMRRPQPDDLEVMRIKEAKMRTKDQLEELGCIRRPQNSEPRV